MILDPDMWFHSFHHKLIRMGVGHLLRIPYPPNVVDAERLGGGDPVEAAERIASSIRRLVASEPTASDVETVRMLHKLGMLTVEGERMLGSRLLAMTRLPYPHEDILIEVEVFRGVVRLNGEEGSIEYTVDTLAVEPGSRVPVGVRGPVEVVVQVYPLGVRVRAKRSRQIYSDLLISGGVKKSGRG